MADLLIRHLKAKAEEHSNLEMLVNQWGFDEKLIPKALQTIGNLFPHYSSHDESHSKQILINIERLLGNKNISKLTATDTWLLLEAAYWHDIGMVVPHKDIEDAFKDPEFKRYLNQINSSPNHELNKFCLSFDENDVNKCFSGASTPMDAMDKLRQLMAEWFRLKHANRGSEIINAPWKSVGLSSPRTELIPNRLFILLGRVCQMHGRPFQDILNPGGLHYREAGLAQEDCHPRFVACLLRMGDLLDIDDNRFCPVMQRIAGEDRPAISKAHEDKHASIRHLRVDRERIEISAECETIDGYLETYQWFDWLKQEIQNQMAHWRDIVPSREFGLLPTLGNIHVNLMGNQQLLAEGQKPQFSIDSEQAITLLQGENLYSSKFACIKELLQNAVDATLLNLWITKKTGDEEWQSPISETPKEIFKNTPVSAELINSSTKSTPTDKTQWTLRITDKGTGISQNDLQYMLKIGGSRKNDSRQEKINQMPEWMKPSGTFGIGFQSAFMITEFVTITTKDVFSNKITEIIMHSPTGPREGLTTIKELDQDISISPGTTLELSFPLDKKSPSWTYNWNRDSDSISQQLVNNYDPIDDSFPFKAAQLFDKIREFSVYSMLPIECSFQAENSLATFPAYFNEIHDKFGFLEVEEGLLLLFYQPLTQFHTSRTISEATYRGQSFEHKLTFTNYLSVRIDLLSGKAGEWLNFNREKILSSEKHKLVKLVRAALQKQILIDLEKCRQFSQQEKMTLSFYLRLMSLQDKSWEKIAGKLNIWQGLQLGLNTTASYSELSKKEKWTMSEAVDKTRYAHISSEAPEDEKCDLLITPSKPESWDIESVYFEEWLNTPNHSIKVLESDYYNDGNERLKYEFSKTQHTELYTKKALSTALMKMTGHFNYNTRYVLCFEDDTWRRLGIKPDQEVSGVTWLFDIPTKNREFVILPFLYLFTENKESNSKICATNDQINKLVEYVLPRLSYESTFEEIRQKYDDLINYIDTEVMEPSPFREKWYKARGLELPITTITESTE